MVLNNSGQLIRRSYRDEFSTDHRRPRKHYGRPQPPVQHDPFRLIIWENIGYLVEDDRRKIAFEELERTTGLEQSQVCRVPGKEDL